MMNDPVTGMKIFIFATLAALAPAAGDAIISGEMVVMGIPLSGLLVSIAGTLIGFVILPDHEAGRLIPSQDIRRLSRVLQAVSRIIALAVVVLCYAILSAWAVSLLAHIIPALRGAPELPLAGAAGIFIRPLLPAILTKIQDGTGVIGGQK